MASATFLYNTARLYLLDGTLDLDTVTWKCMLVASAYTPNVETHSLKSNITNELSTANGYTAGGQTLTPSLTRSTGTVTFDLTDADWTVSTAPLVARYAVVYASGTYNTRVDPLLFYTLLDTAPNDVTAPVGEHFKIVWSPSGIFTLTGG